MRRTALVALAIAATVSVPACGLGRKEGMANQVATAIERLESAGAVRLDMTVAVAPLQRPDTILEQAPRIMEVPPVKFPAIVDFRRGTAAVGLRDEDASTAALVFRDTRVYQRIAPKSTSSGPQLPNTSVSNLLAIRAVLDPASVPLAVEDGADQPATTSTTEKPSALRREARIPRVWVAFDYGELDEEDGTKRAGSYAINPRDVLRLVHGLLTGSIERTSAGEMTEYAGNVNRDKAERKLPEERRELLDKVFKANAVSKRTFPARVWIDRSGELRRFEVRMRQELTNIDRADLIVTIEVVGAPPAVDIARPDPKATSTVGSLGQLVTAVTRS